MAKTAKKPAFLILKEDILARIADGTYQKDMRLPSERQFGEQWGISRMTVRRALDELVQAGVLYRTRGSGTYISQKKIQQQDIMSFSDMARNKGMQPATRILEKSVLTDGGIAQQLELPADASLVMLKRLRLADETPIAIEQVYLPLSVCPGLQDLEATGSLYEILLEQYGLRIQRQELRISATSAAKAERDLLKLQKGAPVLHIEGVSLTTEGKPLLFEQSVYVGESFLLEVGITKRKG